MYVEVRRLTLFCRRKKNSFLNVFPKTSLLTFFSLLIRHNLMTLLMFPKHSKKFELYKNVNKTYK